MASLTPEQVRHIAKLARLRLTDAEVEAYAKEMSAIVGYIETLSAVDTTGVEATAQATGIENSLRGDSILQDGPPSDALLGCSGLPITEHQIETPSAHG